MTEAFVKAGIKAASVHTGDGAYNWNCCVNNFDL